jgi:hypothetical protein
VADFVTGGAVPIESDAYVSRSFENECFGELSANNWVLLLGPRQHGKSSALFRLRRRLQENGIQTALIDFQAFGAPDDYSSLLRWFVSRTASAFDVTFAEPPIGGEDDMEACLTANQPTGQGSLAVLIDEAGAVPSAWQNRFFSQLRALYNTRAGAEPGSLARRIVFLFAGTFRPERLVNPDNSPFNVSRDVKSSDLTREQVGELASRVGGDALGSCGDAAYALVGGQPYLVQVLLDAVSRGDDDDEREGLFTEAVGRLKRGGDRHFASLFEKVLGEARLTTLLADIASAEDGIEFNAADSDQNYLDVLGAARIDGDRLVIRNALYRELVLNNPQFSPGTEAQTADQFLVAPESSAFTVVADDDLRQFAVENFAAAVNAHNAGNHRLALAGFGSVLEAVLLAHLSSLRRDKLRSARDEAFRGRAPDGAPSAWKLSEIIKVAGKSEALSHTNLGPADALRDWRNLIHPAKAVRRFQPEAALRPEARMGVEVIQAVIRDLTSD